MEEEEEEQGVPVDVLEPLARLECNLENLEAEVRALLRTCNGASLPFLSPLERASVFLALSKAVNSLFSLYLRSRGECIDNHPMLSEVKRVKLYEDKVERFINTSKAPMNSTSAIDVPAVNRFIEHAIPDLTQEQKQQMKEISKAPGRHKQSFGDGFYKNRNKTRNQIDPARTQSITEAADAFLKQAQGLLAKNEYRENAEMYL